MPSFLPSALPRPVGRITTARSLVQKTSPLPSFSPPSRLPVSARLTSPSSFPSPSPSPAAPVTARRVISPRTLARESRARPWLTNSIVKAPTVPTAGRLQTTKKEVKAADASVNALCQAISTMSIKQEKDARATTVKPTAATSVSSRLPTSSRPLVSSRPVAISRPSATPRPSVSSLPSAVPRPPVGSRPKPTSNTPSFLVLPPLFDRESRRRIRDERMARRSPANLRSALRPSSAQHASDKTHLLQDPHLRMVAAKVNKERWMEDGQARVIDKMRRRPFSVATEAGITGYTATLDRWPQPDPTRVTRVTFSYAPPLYQSVSVPYSVPTAHFQQSKWENNQGSSADHIPCRDDGSHAPYYLSKFDQGLLASFGGGAVAMSTETVTKDELELFSPRE